MWRPKRPEEQQRWRLRRLGGTQRPKRPEKWRRWRRPDEGWRQQAWKDAEKTKKAEVSAAWWK